MTERLLQIGLDAVEISLMERLMAAGRAPNLSRLAAAGRMARMVPVCMDTLPGAIWPDLHTGIPSHVHGEYFHPEQIHTGEAAPRQLERSELDPERYHWVRAARTGKRVVVIDPVQAGPAADLNGVQVLEWAIHDNHWGALTVPAPLAAAVEERHGTSDPVRCERHDGTVPSYRKLRADLLAQARAKADLAVDLLTSTDWDLGFVTFCEGHCAGHQFWHFNDVASPFHEPDAPADLVDTVPAIYEAIDDSIGRVIAAVGLDVPVMVVFSHGMGPSVGGYRLLGPVLTGLGYGRSRPALAKARSRVHPRVRSFLRDHVVPRAITDRYQLDRRGLERRGLLVAPVPNNRIGAIRYNLRGREAGGELDPADVPEVRRRIADELLALVHPPSGEKMVESVRTPAELFGPDHHPDLPDLLVEFRRDLGVLEDCEGPTVGRLHAPSRTPLYDRTGDHTARSGVIISGPGMDAVPLPATSLEVAPTILSILGVEEPVAGG